MTSTTRLVPIASFRVAAGGLARMEVLLPSPVSRYRYIDVSVQAANAGPADQATQCCAAQQLPRALMTTVSRTFSVDPPPPVVIAYLADFAHATQWDPGTVRCVRTDTGPVRVGSSWRNTSKIAGISTELTYTLEQLTDARIVLVGRNNTATSTETIDVTPSGTGSSITYTNEVQFNGAAKLASPLVKIVFEKLARDTERQIRETLNALAI